MPKKKLLRSTEFPYHVSARANNRELFPGEIDYVWKTLTDELYLQAILREIRVHAFLLMPNHFHLLITCPTDDLGEVMRCVLSSATRIINTRYRRWGRLFGANYHWSMINDALYYAHALKYVYRNPVRAGLCENVTDFSFSTFSAVMGNGILPLKLERPFLQLDRMVPQNLASQEEWLDQSYKSEESEAIRKALRRREFKLPVDRGERRHNATLNQKYPETKNGGR